MRRALDLRRLLEIGIRLTLDEIDADELYAMMVIDEERNKREDEKAKER